MVSASTETCPRNHQLPVDQVQALQTLPRRTSHFPKVKEKKQRRRFSNFIGEAPRPPATHRCKWRETDPSRRATSWNLDHRCRVEKRGIAFRAVSLTDGVEKRHLVWKDSFCWIPPFRDISHPSIARNQGVVDLCSFLAAVSTSKTTQEPLSSPPSRYDAKMI